MGINTSDASLTQLSLSPQKPGWKKNRPKTEPLSLRNNPKSSENIQPELFISHVIQDLRATAKELPSAIIASQMQEVKRAHDNKSQYEPPRETRGLEAAAEPEPYAEIPLKKDLFEPTINPVHEPAPIKSDKLKLHMTKKQPEVAVVKPAEKQGIGTPSIPSFALLESRLPNIAPQTKLDSVIETVDKVNLTDITPMQKLEMEPSTAETVETTIDQLLSGAELNYETQDIIFSDIDQYITGYEIDEKVFSEYQTAELPVPLAEVEVVFSAIVQSIEAPEPKESEALFQNIETIVGILADPTEDMTTEQLELIEDELKEIVIQLFQAVEVEQSPELIEAFIMVMKKGYHQQNLEMIQHVAEDTSMPAEIIPREFMQKIHHGLQAVQRSAARLLSIGKSTLQLYSLQHTFALT